MLLKVLVDPVMQIYPGMPPYTDTSGRGRVGGRRQPLTGTIRRRIMVETGTTIPLLSPIFIITRDLECSLEYIREAARREQALRNY